MQLKFRAYCYEDSIAGSKGDILDAEMIDEHELVVHRNKLCAVNSCDKFGFNLEPLPVLLDIWTGLVDKDGKEVYKNDILVIDESIEDLSERFLVKFEHAEFYLKSCKGKYNHSLCELLLDGKICGRIMGSIHQNPELLENNNV